MTATTHNTASPFAPLSAPAFRGLWIAALFLNVGLWMQVVGAGWLMVSLSATPLMVALVQTASSLPFFFFALPGGVMADLVDRRRFLLGGQLTMTAVALALAGFCAADLISPISLLLLTFAFGSVQALQGPAWFTSQIDAAPPATHLAAVSLSGASYSCARAVGPALAGWVISRSGVTGVFIAVTGLSAIAALQLWRGAPIARPDPTPPTREGLWTALAAGFRFTAGDRMLQVMLWRTVSFISAGAGLWALLPVLASQRMSGGAADYGLLVGCLGVGAVTGAMLLPAARHRLTNRQLDTLGVIAFATTTALSTQTTSRPLLAVAFLLAGCGWTWVGNLNIAGVQLQAPAWVKARVLAVYLIVFQGAMALGGVLWGALADRLDLVHTLLLCSACQLAALLLSRAMPFQAKAAVA